MKQVLTALLVMLTAAGTVAADAPRTSSTVVQFVGRVIDDACSVTVGASGTQIDLDSQKGIVPVDVTFRNCASQTVPSFRLVTDDRNGQAVLSTNTAHTSVRFYRDEAGQECLTAGENLLCSEKRRASGRDQTYRAMYAKLDGQSAHAVKAVAVVEMQYD